MLAATVNNASAWTSVAISWALTVSVLGGYATYTIRKGKALSKRVPEDKRRWM